MSHPLPTSLPPQMSAIVAVQAGGPEVLQIATLDTPHPAAGEVLIRVAAAGVNRPDVMQRKGAYPPPPDANPHLGLEVAGEIVAVGAQVSAWKTGDKVCALVNGGGYAQYCVAPQEQCLPWPQNYTAVQAAALPETMFTVWANLFQTAHLQPGESVLVHGGTSGIGTTTIQLAHALGSKVFATAGSAEKCRRILELGADGAINYREQDFLEEIKRLSPGGVNVVLDMIGAPYFERNLRCLKLEGRLVMIAFMGGTRTEGADLSRIMMRRLTVTGSTMRARTTAQKSVIGAALLRDVWPLLNAGKCPPVIHAVYPLAQAAAAHQAMEDSQHVGKIMLQVD